MSGRLPQRLAAAEPSWRRDVDIVVLGSGAAGLSAALAARPTRDVLVVTKDVLSGGSTAWAQGGLAGVLDPKDSLENHVRDTLAAGAGLCDEGNVRELVAEAPVALRYLMQLGAAFDPAHDGSGGPALTREGGHSHDRIVHAGGDQSGAEVQRTLDENALAAGVEVLAHAFALDLLTGQNSSGERQVAGVRVALLDDHGNPVSVGDITARAVVLATGGYGQVFASTSNPPAVTGDGVALALRAGLPGRDLEFVQMHPTVLYTGPDARGQQALVSEAVRGEGAKLYDAAGERIMLGVHPQEDLAPRDVVAAAISSRMAEAPGGVDDHVYLDATHMGERFYERFPTITESCRAAGVDPAAQRIPVAPAAHYACGGVRADLDGRTELLGLYAVGEVACTGVHGANRLASNSLTEGIVAGTRVGRELAYALPELVAADEPHDVAIGLLDPSHRAALRAAMSKHVGVLRHAGGLGEAASALGSLAGAVNGSTAAARESWETTNLLTVAAAMVAAATARTESRGCHRRTDFPEPRAEWLTHLEERIDHGGAVAVLGGPLAAATLALHPMSIDTEQRLRAGGLDVAAVAALVRAAIAEDLAGGIDITSWATVPADQRSRGVFCARRDGTVAGLAVAAAVVDMVCGAEASDFKYLAGDGDRVAKGPLAEVEAPTRLLLTAERTALNLLCHMSGVATLTRRWADALQGTKARVRDTRKTLPGLRALQKYAVRCGGGVNHRMSLSDAALVKDNHVLAAGGVAEAFAAVRTLASSIPVEIEVDSLAGLHEAVDAGADVILLDNFTVEQMADAVAYRDAQAPKVVLEASGGLTIDVAPAVAATGVDYIAVGELTHSVKVFDIGLDLRAVV
jgi:nicotinate-nucleotide pyrophosphorylase (carboxylating)